MLIAIRICPLPAFRLLTHFLRGVASRPGAFSDTMNYLDATSPTLQHCGAGVSPAFFLCRRDACTTNTRLHAPSPARLLPPADAPSSVASRACRVRLVSTGHGGDYAQRGRAGVGHVDRERVRHGGRRVRRLSVLVVRRAAGPAGAERAGRRRRAVPLETKPDRLLDRPRRHPRPSRRMLDQPPTGHRRPVGGLRGRSLLDGDSRTRSISNSSFIHATQTDNVAGDDRDSVPARAVQLGRLRLARLVPVAARPARSRDAAGAGRDQARSARLLQRLARDCPCRS